MMDNGQPDFVTKLRAQIEGQISNLLEERAAMEPRMIEIDQEVEERRAAIRRLIGAPEPRKAAARYLTDDQILDGVTQFDGEFTPGELGELIGMSSGNVKKRLAGMEALVEQTTPGGPGVSSRYRVKALRES